MEISYGHIDGIKIGQIFETRQALIDAGMHPHREAGIWGSSKNAACSIVLSGGYEDDLDELDFVLKQFDTHHLFYSYLDDLHKHLMLFQ